MSGGNRAFWQLAVRVFLVPVFAWLLAAQSIVLPVIKAQAAQRAGTDNALAILCSPALLTTGDETPDGDKRHVQDMGCCTLCARVTFDLPVAVPAEEPQLIRRVEPFVEADWAPAQQRAPPHVIRAPGAARAPPPFA